MSETIEIYTDGGADPNPGPGGWGVVVVEPGHKPRELSGAVRHTTNNRMELTAAIRALEEVPADRPVTLYTDSRYLKNGVTQWLPGWIRRGWRRKDGAVKNEDLWRHLATLTESHDVTWRWLRGHAGHTHNERADALATAAIRRLKRGALDPDPEGAVGVEADAQVFLRVACRKGQGGWAAAVRSGEEAEVLTGTERETTANRLDLIAACEALESLPEGGSVAIHTPSDYLRNGARSWLSAWKRRGFTTKQGKPVANADLWRRLDRSLAARRVHWPEVKDREIPALDELVPLAKGALEEASRGAGQEPDLSF